MKKLKIKLLYLLLAAATLSVVSCDAIPSVSPEFDETLIVGKWVGYGQWNGKDEYYRYDVDHTGVTWVPEEDVTEEEAQPFTWEFEKSSARLIVIHQLEMGAASPKQYTLTTLNDSIMTYKNIYGKVFTYS